MPLSIAYGNSNQELNTTSSPEFAGINVNGLMQALTGGFGLPRTDGTVHIDTASAGSVSGDANADELVLENDNHTGLSMFSPSNRNSNIYHGSPSDSIGAIHRWGHDAGIFLLTPNKVGAVTTLGGDAQVTNLTLGGASGSITTLLSGFLLKSATDSITAGTTQTQPGATALTTDNNRITVCANTGDVVGLPTARKGSSCTIIHDGANNAGVFPKTSGDNIDGAAADAVDPNALVAGTTRVYDCVTDGTWETAS